MIWASALFAKATLIARSMSVIAFSGVSTTLTQPDRRLQAPPVKGINAAKRLLIGIAWPAAAIDQHP
jgi:hypothetical protein